MPYNPPHRVRTLEVQYKSLVVRADPEFEKDKRRQIEYEFSNRDFFANPALRGAYADD